MFKKFLAALALVAILSTSMAFASNTGPSGTQVPSDGSYISNANATYSFNPTKAETATVSFTLLQNAEILAYVTNTSGVTVATFAGTALVYQPTNAGAVSYSWNGKLNGNVLPDDKYTVNVFAKANGGIVDSFVQTVKISNVNKVAPVISGLKFEPATFSPATGGKSYAYFTTDKNGFITVKVMQGNTTIRTFSEYSNSYFDADTFSIVWDGTDDDNEVVEEGTYTLKVTTSINGGNDPEVNVATTPITALTSGPATGGSVKNYYLDPAGTWNPLKGGLDIHYQLKQKVKSLNIQAKRIDGSITKVIKVLSDKNIDSGYYTETWDGTDDVGNYIDSGTWTINIIADGVTVSENVTAKYTQPAVVEAFVSKDAFDPSMNEMQNFVFKIDAKAVVTVEVYKGSQQKEVTLISEETVQKNSWYTVSWDGRDSDGAVVDDGSDWNFKITAKNETAQDLLAKKNVSFQITDDTVSDKKANVSNDTTSPVVYDDSQSDTINFYYYLDQDASVSIAVYEGNSTGGKAKKILTGETTSDYIEQPSGDHDVSWDGRDTNGKMLKDGIYTYKIIAKVGNNYKETETGTFVIGNNGEYFSPTNPPVKPPVVPPVEPPYVEPPYVTQDCGGYVDTKYVINQNYEMCQAIAWVTQQGIFSGYGDGSFAPNTAITRSEVLKVVLKSFPNITLLPSDGSNQGFWDADPVQWYMPYVRTAKFYNMLQGYKDGSAGVIKHISRAEFLKFALKGSAAFTGYQVPSYSFSYYADVDANSAWYKDFAGVAYDMGFFGYNYSNGSKSYLNPDKEITRGEVALILYKMYNNYLLGYGPVDYNYGY